MSVTVPNAHLMEPSAFQFRVDNGAELHAEIPQAFRVAVQMMQERCRQHKNGYIKLVLDVPFRPRRTGPHSGSAHFHGHCQTICADTGNDFEDVKMALKRRAMRRGYPAQTKGDGSIRYSLVDGLPLPQSERDASIEQENMLIEEAHQLAAELDIRLVEYEE